jgi:hypothetical protein
MSAIPAPLQSFAAPLGSVAEFTAKEAFIYRGIVNGYYAPIVPGNYLTVPISPGLPTRKIALYCFAVIDTSSGDNPANYPHGADLEMRFYRHGNLMLNLPIYIQGANNSQLGQSRTNWANVTRHWVGSDGITVNDSDDFTQKGFDTLEVSRSGAYNVGAVYAATVKKTVNCFEISGDFDRADIVCTNSVSTPGSTNPYFFGVTRLEIHLQILSTRGIHRTQYEITG